MVPSGSAVVRDHKAEAPWVSDVGYCTVVSMGKETGLKVSKISLGQTNQLTVERVCGRKKVLFAGMDGKWTEHLQRGQ